MRTITPAEIEQRGTKPYPGKSPAQVMKASVVALKTLGFDVVVADAGKVKTAPKTIQVSAVGGAYSATAIEDALAWTLDVDAASDGSVIHAHPRSYRNGQPLDERNLGYNYMSHAFSDLFKEIDDNLPGGVTRPRGGRLAPEVIQHVVRVSFPKIRACYEKGLARDAKLHGKVKVRFVIDESGHVSSAEDYGSTLPDADAVACVLAVYRRLSFPEPDGGTVTVVYPINFDVGVAPGLGAAAASD
jgi:TonB family protein